ncbi:MAG: hypothetical protein LC781_08785 [Actinobacteria bacterium]|nr:hypothetical protein [Actinomycetota bacterium]
MRKSMLLAAMLAMVLVVTVPAVAQVANTGEAQNSLGIVSYGPAGDDVGTGDGGSSEDACRDRVVERLAGELGISEEEAEELLDLVREFVDAEEFDAFFGELCDR